MIEVSITEARMHYGRLGWTHALSDGGAVLLGAESWRTINGLYLTLPWRKRLWITWRHGR